MVLAGGAGRRLGLGQPKALVMLGGRTLLDRAGLTLLDTCDAVVVAAPAGFELTGCTLPRADDPSAAAGPLAGIVGATRRRGDRVAVVLGVDFPLVTTGLLRALIARLRTHDAVIPAPGGRPQPLVAVYAPAALAHLAAALEAGERAVTVATATLEADRPDDRVLAGLEGGIGAFLNVNTGAELEVANRRLGARRSD